MKSLRQVWAAAQRQTHKRLHRLMQAFLRFNQRLALIFSIISLYCSSVR